LKERSEGILYLVATPIGNGEDISSRAIRVLHEANVIACEDTRRTARLLSAHQISTPTLSYFEHNEERRIPDLIARLQRGETVALVTDAGTPGISDPGFRLVRAAIDAGIRVSAIPGPSAVITALSVAGLPTDRFIFEGFLPAKAGDRRRALERLRREPCTIVFYAAARRLAESLQAMVEVFGADRPGVVLRELTKTHEEIRRGTLGELATYFTGHEALGEITIVLAGASHVEASGGERSAIDEAATLAILREAGLSLKDASEVLAKLTGARRREIYQRALRERG
jgi:16S rRNA (cytidine1402-2'-O)-methyltransferase